MCSALVLVVVALLGARSAAADAITFTGNVTNDFNPATTNPGVTIITTACRPQPRPTTGETAPPLERRRSGDASRTSRLITMPPPTRCMSASKPRVSPAASLASTIATGNGMAVGFAPLIGTYNHQRTSPAPAFVAGDLQRGPAGESNAAAGRGPGWTGSTSPRTREARSGHHEPVDRFRSNAHGGHGQPCLRSQHGNTRL